MPKLLVRYGEIGLKSDSVRRRFEQQLVGDIRNRHAMAKVPCVISQTRGRIFVDSDDWRKSCEILSRTFGIVSFSPVTEVPSELRELTKGALEYADPLMFEGASFAVRTRRSGNHEYTSQTLAAHLGEALLKEFGRKEVRVSLDAPDVELFVEVRDRTAYLFSSSLAGPGGMPLGTQGKILSVVDSERGLASTWLMMKRGCSVLVARDDQNLAPLDPWYPSLRSVKLTEDMFAQAMENDCAGVALPWRLAELEHIRPPKGELPVFYPLIGMRDEDVKGLLRRILA